MFMKFLTCEVFRCMHFRTVFIGCWVALPDCSRPSLSGLKSGPQQCMAGSHAGWHTAGFSVAQGWGCFQSAWITESHCAPAPPAGQSGPQVLLWSSPSLEVFFMAGCRHPTLAKMFFSHETGQLRQVGVPLHIMWPGRNSHFVTVPQFVKMQISKLLFHQWYGGPILWDSQTFQGRLCQLTLLKMNFDFHLFIFAVIHSSRKARTWWASATSFMEGKICILCPQGGVVVSVSVLLSLWNTEVVFWSVRVVISAKE